MKGHSWNNHFLIILLLDPTQIDWGNEKEDDPPTPQEPVPPAVPGVASATQTFKCTALYSYTVRIMEAIYS